jgi:hypothetical protein
MILTRGHIYFKLKVECKLAERNDPVQFLSKYFAMKVKISIFFCIIFWTSGISALYKGEIFLCKNKQNFQNLRSISDIIKNVCLKCCVIYHIWKYKNIFANILKPRCDNFLLPYIDIYINDLLPYHILWSLFKWFISVIPTLTLLFINIHNK